MRQEYWDVLRLHPAQLSAGQCIQKGGWSGESTRRKPDVHGHREEKRLDALLINVLWAIVIHDVPLSFVRGANIRGHLVRQYEKMRNEVIPMVEAKVN